MRFMYHRFVLISTWLRPKVAAANHSFACTSFVKWFFIIIRSVLIDLASVYHAIEEGRVVMLWYS